MAGPPIEEIARKAARSAETTEAEGATAAAEAAAIVPSLLGQWTPERIDRFVSIVRGMRRRGWFRRKTSLALAASSLSGETGDADGLVSACEAEAAVWRGSHGWWSRMRLGLDTEESLVVVARKLAEGPSVPPLAAISAEIAEMRRAGLHAESCRPTLAAQMISAEPDAAARFAWYQRTAATWKRLKRLHPWIAPSYGERLVTWLVRDPAVDVEERVIAVERTYERMRAAKVGARGGMLMAAIVHASVATSIAEEEALCARAAELGKRLKRQRRWFERDWVASEPLLALLSIASSDVDVLAGLVSSVREDLAKQKVKDLPAVTLFLVVEMLAQERPALRALLHGYGDVLIRQLVEAEQQAAGAGAGA